MTDTPEFKIDHDVPLPSHKRGPGTYPWGQMAVANSIFVKGQTPSGGAIVSARSFAKRQSPEWTFTSRTVEGGVRIWRVA